MKRDAALYFVLLISITLTSSAQTRMQSCLPQGIKPTDVISAGVRKPGAVGQQINVEQKLSELGARCRKGRLVDARGREIRFYRLKGCWGNPPPDYQEILQKQDAELRRLKKRYTVVEMTCNPSGEQIS